MKCRNRLSSIIDEVQHMAQFSLIDKKIFINVLMIKEKFSGG